MDVEKVIEGLEQLKFFNQRAGRELWNSKPANIQNVDINNSEKKLDEAIQTIRELQEQIPKWHLVADGDLPTNDDNRFYLCISENHEEDLPTMFQYDSESGFGWWEDIYDPHTLGFVDSEFHTIEDEHLENVIAWRELPKFEEAE